MIVVKLEEQDSVKSFDCGDDDLNDFILHESPLYRKEKLAVTYVLKEADDLANEHIKAFFSLSNDRISISDFDSKTKYNRFSRRFNNHKRLKSYPAAIPFYLRNGFVPLNEEDADEPTRLLYFDLNDSAMASCHSTKRMPTNPRGCSTSTSTTWTKIDRHAAPSLPLKQD